ncbi:hypothetical protein BLA9940_05932 [Burkholderia aenigmatica]|uniref:hypothetical protein n=1 Tax=Burkholderia cepacia complex TaxID=87882 RepID=UPI000F08CA46|nr:MULTISPECIES: hypothetical protein [Burkholderia cepacia complex]AYQ37626.1 hypothetical protein CVS37_05505 [Burkholderia lata]VWC97976.1 hypothetical protein BLA9940_05932 [Burkholderia aenigmatica]
MKDIKSLSTKIDKTRETITRLQAEREQAEATIAAAGNHDGPLAERRGERQRLQATALVLKRKPDTAKIDTEIEQLEALRTTAIAAADASRAALPVYDDAIRIARTELAEFEVERKSAVVEHIMETHDAAQKRYLDAVAAMESAVVEMVGADLAYRAIFNIRADAVNVFPGRGKQVLEDVRATGVRVPWDHSRLKDPEIAASYTDDYRDYWYPPAWAARELKGIGDDCASRLVSDVVSGGYPCNAYVGHVEKVQKTVKVRIVRGTFPTTVSRKLSPVSGVIMSSETHTYMPGDDIELEETYARQLVDARMVVIHGEGELPPSRAELARGAVIPRTEDGHRLVELDLARETPRPAYQPGGKRTNNDRSVIG